MENAKRAASFGLLGFAPLLGLRASAVARKRAKRNPWIVIGFFGLVIAAWLKSQM